MQTLSCLKYIWLSLVTNSWPVAKRLSAVIALCILFISHMASAQMSDKKVQYLDDGQLMNITVTSEFDGEQQAVKVMVGRDFRAQQSQTTIPVDLLSGLEIYVDGKHFKADYFSGSSFRFDSMSKTDSTGWIPTPGVISKVEIHFQGQIIGKYKSEQGILTALTSPKVLSRFDIRNFSQHAVLKKDVGTYSSAPARLVNKDLKKWIFNPIFARQQPGKYTPKVDLHTHLTGAISSHDLIEIAERLQVPYPVKLLEKMGLDYQADKVQVINGERYIPFSRNNFSFATYHSGHDYYWASLYDYFDINPHESVPFEKMSEVYKMRDPLVKNIKLFPLILESIAKDYQKNGVKYAELSFYTIVKPEWFKIANDLVPRLEKDYGVKLRFLTGLWRHSSNQESLEALQETKRAVKESPYIVGVDFMGHETNATSAFSKVVTEVTKLKKQYPELAIRVHAGENPTYPDNIKDAILAGATRIGHGIYGATDEVIHLAREKNVIIEFNFSSNLALQNIDSTKQLVEVAKRYLAGGVRVTLGTDGHGLYHTSPMSEEAVARSLGFTDKDFELMTQSDRDYVQAAEKNQNPAPMQGNMCSRIFL